VAFFNIEGGKARKAYGEESRFWYGEMAMRCPRCGVENPEGSRCCGSCGSAIHLSPSSIQSARPTVSQPKRSWSASNWKALTAAIIVLVVVLAVFGVTRIEPDYHPNSFTIKGMNVNDFTYVLQYDSWSDRHEARADLAKTPYDLLIMDSYYSCDAPDYGEGRWTSDEIDQIASGEGESSGKLVLSYLSIGEAETYRPYWNPGWDANDDGVPDSEAPEWLDIENPEWEGNYKVKYWLPSWQTLVFGSPDSALDIILGQNFDGVYMDLIDAYEYYEEQGVVDAARRMVDFVISISAYAKAEKAGFLLVPQNGEALAEISGYLDAVDGTGREDVLYIEDDRQPEEETEDVAALLQIFLNGGKFVLEIEYPTSPRAVNACYDFAEEQGYICYVGPVELDRIQVNHGFMPD